MVKQFATALLGRKQPEELVKEEAFWSKAQEALLCFKQGIRDSLGFQFHCEPVPSTKVREALEERARRELLLSFLRLGSGFSVSKPCQLGSKS